MAAKKRAPKSGTAAYQAQMRKEYEALRDIEHNFAMHMHDSITRAHLAMMNDDANRAGEPPLDDDFDPRYCSMPFPDVVQYLEHSVALWMPKYGAPIIAFCKKYPDTPEAHALADEFNAFQKATADVTKWANKHF